MGHGCAVPSYAEPPSCPSFLMPHTDVNLEPSPRHRETRPSALSPRPSLRSLRAGAVVLFDLAPAAVLLLDAVGVAHLRRPVLRERVSDGQGCGAGVLRPLERHHV